MNCQDISLAMDDRDIGALDEAQRREFDAHLEACPDCARDWDLHVRLAATRTPPLPGNLQRRIEMSLPVRTSGFRASRRLVVIGGVVALAAAAMFAVNAMREPSPSASVAEQAVPVAEVPAPQAVSVEAVAERISPPAPAAVAGEASPPAPPAPLAVQGTVRVFPLQNQATGPAYLAVETFFTELLANLRAVPGLAVLGPDQPEPNGAAPAQLRVRGFGPVLESKFTMEIRLEKLQPDGSYKLELLASSGGEIAAQCVGAPPSDTMASCRTPSQMAAVLVRGLRGRLLPPDPSLRRDAQTRLADQSLTPIDRLGALSELRGKLNEPAILQSAIDLAKTATDPTVREQAWLMLYRLRSPELVAPLTEAMVRDPDANVRLQAMTVGAVDFPDDPRLREAFETIRQADAKPMLRALAMGGFEAGGYWYRYMGDSLKDTSRPDAERIEALAYQLSSPLPWNLQAFLKDNNALPALGDLLPRMMTTSPAGNQPMLLLSRLAPIDDPAITDLVLKCLEKRPNISLSILRSMLGNRSDDSRVRAALERIGAKDPDPNVRQAVADMLKKP